MRSALEKVVGVVRWLGVVPNATTLPRDVVVVSPHLDDGVFSLGAAIAAATRRGVAITVLTVLAGNPDSDVEAGEWDARAGFRTAGEASRARRLEDRRACRLVGADPAWLPYSDSQYERGGTDDEISAAVCEVVGRRPVLLPGFPLRHDDHRWLHDLLRDAFPPARLGLYTEQPYGAAHTDRPGVSQEPTAREAPAPDAWTFPRASARDRIRKLAACRAYASQLPLFDSALLTQITRYEARVGGESIVAPPTR